MKEFYLSLPDQKQFSFFVPYYTPILQKFDYVRIVPDQTFVKGFVDSEYENAFFKVDYPCYYIPIKKDNVHWGFILKGQGKHTPSYTNWVRCFNFDSLFGPDQYVCLVEGMKDAGIFIEYGLPVLSYLTSYPGKDLIDLIVKMGKYIIFCPDGDLAGQNAQIKFKKNMHDLGYDNYYVHQMVGDAKDFGDYYKPELTEYVLMNFQNVKNILRSLG
jgi:hypothetical protein